ncbi:hypothetical protein TWF281_000179 [Arthrobotrys megalospora]
MHLSTTISPLVIFLGLVVSTAAVGSRLCIDSAWLPGECVIQIDWRRITTDEYDDRSKQNHKIYERVRSTVFDANGTQISPLQATDSYQACTGQGGEECIAKSALPDVIKMSPQIQRDYMQFYFGGQAWHTDPNPSDKNRPYVGPDFKNMRPWCDDKGWVEWPKDNGLYKFPYDVAERRYISVLRKDLTCWFECRDIRVTWGDPNVGVCPEPQPAPVAMNPAASMGPIAQDLTGTITQTSTMTVTQTSMGVITQLSTTTVIRSLETTATLTQISKVTVTQTPEAGPTQISTVTVTQTPEAGPIQTSTVTVTQPPEAGPIQTSTVTVTQSPDIVYAEAPTVTITQTQAAEALVTRTLDQVVVQTTTVTKIEIEIKTKTVCGPQLLVAAGASRLKSPMIGTNITGMLRSNDTKIEHKKNLKIRALGERDY